MVWLAALQLVTVAWLLVCLVAVKMTEGLETGEEKVKRRIVSEGGRATPTLLCWLFIPHPNS